MNEYIIYFEIFGKKMRTTILASSKNEAEIKLRQKLTIIKISKKNNVVDDLFGFFK